MKKISEDILKEYAEGYELAKDLFATKEEYIAYCIKYHYIDEE